ncbi:MAG: hypothetical protein WED04_09270 [Promethearchaeati archaeon SRVP18_Atabeyarchaeia-1]
MRSERKNLLVVFLLLGIVCGCLVAAVPTASALASPTYNLEVSVGDYATYNVDQQNLTSFGHLDFRQGDRMRVYLAEKYVIRISDKLNNEILGYEMPRLDIYVNDTWSGWDSGHLQDIFKLSEVFYGITPGPFFFPVGPGRLWNAIEDYFPPLQVTASGNQLTLVYENFAHWDQDGGATNYWYECTKVLIDAGTGVALRLEYSKDVNGDVESVVLSLVETNISSLPVLAVLLQYWYIVFPPILVLSAVLVYASRSRSRVRGHRKEEILGRLSDEKLLKLARTVLGEKAGARMGRANLVETVKNSLSLEEIKRRIRD